MGFKEDAVEIIKKAGLTPEEQKETMKIVDGVIASEGKKVEKGIKIFTLDELWKGRGPDKKPRKRRGISRSVI